MKNLLVLLSTFLAIGIAFPQIGEALDQDLKTKKCTTCNGKKWGYRCRTKFKSQEVRENCCLNSLVDCEERCGKTSSCTSGCQSAYHTCEDKIKIGRNKKIKAIEKHPKVPTSPATQVAPPEDDAPADRTWTFTPRLKKSTDNTVVE